jgi:Uma2 family endonuclease
VAFARLPENSDQEFEFIYGEIVKKSPGCTTNSEFSVKLDRKVYPFCIQHNIPCHVSVGDGAYRIQGHIVAPDFAFKKTPMIDEYPDPVAPEWAVEVISPTDEPELIRAKREIYVEAGILYWEIYPLSRKVDVYAPGKPLRTVDVDGTLDGDKVLPGLDFPARDLFE